MDRPLTPHAARNRETWNRTSDEYQAAHAAQLAQHGAAWGVWQIPEDEVRALGEVAGRDILELGCGAAQWSIALAKRGARMTGLDLSERQLEHARGNLAAAGIDLPLVQASAEALPFADASFDVVFCDHGAMTFADPQLTVPEVARVLRDGGTFAFSASSLFHFLCDERGPGDTWRLTETLQRDYFGITRREDETGIDFTLGYGDWIRLFRANGFAIEALIELRAPEGAETSYSGFVEHNWARRWPAEQIWKLRREPREPAWVAPVTLNGSRVRLEPLSPVHRAGLIDAVKEDEAWKLSYTAVPSPEGMAAEIARRLEFQRAGSMLPFAVIDLATGRIAGMTTYMNVDPARRRVEIGSTWYRKSVRRTALNTETKLLLLTHAFETLDSLAVEFRTSALNLASRTAIERLGAKLDGILRSHGRHADGSLRDTYVYSITAPEWPAVKARLGNTAHSRRPIAGDKPGRAFG